ncbi:MAG: bifunctional SulP family inorganic anion transporter/carbonic anhydrase, partial [Planctomycetaceae bacterium]|nr:bifunctional SulP family inorganic anion transporter/carbonic anhydrase [Planctomycetaceae bacterium]
IPHVLGHDTDPEGEMSFVQPDHETTFSELVSMLSDIHPGAAVVGLCSVAVLVFWESSHRLKRTRVPAPFVVVMFGMLCEYLLRGRGMDWAIGATHLVRVPESAGVSEFRGMLSSPDWSLLAEPAVYSAAFTIAVVASLETLLNLEAVDQLDPQQRQSPPNRELLAQGVGNMLAGFFGGLPMTSVIVRGSVNINSGAATRMSAVFHGALLLGSVVFFAAWLNQIPISCLAAILLVTGTKLASPALVKRMWSDGRYQFTPFIVTVAAIVLTDLLTGVLIGLGLAITFILNSNLKRPVRQIVERHVGTEVLRLQLAEQVSFLNRAGLETILRGAAPGTHVLLDAHNSIYIDPDVLGLIRDYREHIAPARGITVSLKGFRKRYRLHDDIRFVDYSARDLRDQMSAADALRILADGNTRFRTGQQISRDFSRQIAETAPAQHPFAVVLSCIDSRTPAELVFDLGLGDIFSVRLAGNVISLRVLGSMEYGCVVAGAKLILVLGHTRCGAVTAAVDLAKSSVSPREATGCQHLDPILSDIQEQLSAESLDSLDQLSPDERIAFVDRVAANNVVNVVNEIMKRSSTLVSLVDQKKIGIVGAMYDVSSGNVAGIREAVRGLDPDDVDRILNND